MSDIWFQPSRSSRMAETKCKGYSAHSDKCWVRGLPRRWQGCDKCVQRQSRVDLSNKVSLQGGQEGHVRPWCGKTWSVGDCQCLISYELRRPDGMERNKQERGFRLCIRARHP